MNQEKSSLNNNYRQKIDERAELFDGHEKTVYKCGYKDGFIDCEEYTAPLREELEKLRAENERLKDEITESNKQQTDLSYCALELTPLSQISDEDLKVIADILSFHDGEGLIIFRKKVAGKFNGDIELYDKYNDNPHYINTLFFFTKPFDFCLRDENGNWFRYDVERIRECIDFLRERGYYVGDGKEVEDGLVKLKGLGQ